MSAAHTAKIPVVTLIASAFLVVCVATPLPMPPSIDPTADIERFNLVAEGTGVVILSGSQGAINRGEAEVEDLRVTGPSAWTEVSLELDGSFVASLRGTLSDVYYIEVIVPEQDIFLLSLTSAVDYATEAVDPSPDEDGDGSPDLIDCAPGNPELGGQRCEIEQTCVPEVCNGLDDDCDGTIDEGCNIDEDGDGFSIETDCNDNDILINPGAIEVCNEIDDDCDAAIDEGCDDDDGDNDGFPVGEDCNDEDPTVHPGATDICNLVDDDCDGEIDELGCANACAENNDCNGGVCLEGVCSCLAGEVLCSTVCVNTESDPNNCGECRRACEDGQSCIGSFCF